MAAPGRPTHRPDAAFEDVAPEDYARPDQNPHVRAHLSFGRPLLPAGEIQRYARRVGALFEREAPLILEIGSGNGDFLAEMAVRNPALNFLGVEIRYKRTILCARKIRAAGVTNALIARYHAAYLRDLFGEGQLAGIWVNHPDPWPKERHEKNRLISRWFLEDAAFFLKPGGFLRVKSDFAPNCDRVAELIAHGPDGEDARALPFTIVGRSSDVNGAGAPWDDDVKTNYQGKMQRKGVPVHAIEVVRTAGVPTLGGDSALEHST